MKKGLVSATVWLLLNNRPAGAQEPPSIGSSNSLALPKVSVSSVRCPGLPAGSKPGEITRHRNEQLTSVSFDHDSAELSSAAQVVLKRQAPRILELLDADQMGYLSVLGFADDSGSYSYNSCLEQRRVRAVTAVLVSLGVPEDCIEGGGVGANWPDEREHGDADLAQHHRRVDLAVTVLTRSRWYGDSCGPCSGVRADNALAPPQWGRSLTGVSFEPNSFTLSSSAQWTLTNDGHHIRELLAGDSARYVELFAWSQGTGTGDDDMCLLQRRMEAVKNFLISERVPAKCIAGVEERVETSSSDRVAKGFARKARQVEVQVTAEPRLYERRPIDWCVGGSNGREP